MNLQKFTSSKIFRIIGIILVIYFAFIKNKDNPNYITSQINSESIKKTYHEAKEKTNFITSNLKQAKENAKQGEAPTAVDVTTQPQTVTQETAPIKNQPTPAANADIVPQAEAQSPAVNIENLGKEVEDKNYKIACGDGVEVSYSLQYKNSFSAGAIDKEQMIIGQNSNYFIEKDLVGAHKGETKKINIPAEFNVDKKTGAMKAKKNSDLSYIVTVKRVRQGADTNIKCNFK